MSQCLQSARLADRLSHSHVHTISDLPLPLAAPASGICRADRAAVGEGLSTGHTVFSKSTEVSAKLIDSAIIRRVKGRDNTREYIPPIEHSVHRQPRTKDRSC